MAKQIMEYQTDDGKRFPTKLAAEKWEKVLEIKAHLDDLYEKDKLYLPSNLNRVDLAESLVEHFKISPRKAKDGSDEAEDSNPVPVEAEAEKAPEAVEVPHVSV